MEIPSPKALSSNVAANLAAHTDIPVFQFSSVLFVWTIDIYCYSLVEWN